MKVNVTEYKLPNGKQITHVIEFPDALKERFDSMTESKCRLAFEILRNGDMSCIIEGTECDEDIIILNNVDPLKVLITAKAAMVLMMRRQWWNHIYRDNPKLTLGTVVGTKGVTDLANQIDISNLLTRHMNNDWGDLCNDDRISNEMAIMSGKERVFSVYKITEDLTIWIITEYDRSVTTVLLPSEY